MNHIDIRDSSSEFETNSFDQELSGFDSESGTSECVDGPVQLKLFGGIGLIRLSTSAKSSMVDKEGFRHIMLCRVILGNMEVVHPGFQQFHPSSELFDSGGSAMYERFLPILLFQEKKITRHTLVQRVRQIAGDKLVLAIIKSLRSNGR
ncbi:hypothetical protein HHK36_028148 [Tetracentron sinense]|uniref:RST domain-containing protein n=1 Tax=Tetracentron sinense TaxID=13715 RepID=A0A834YFA0_TETSI|nr:hypothetical protein HHK36_028148 [Tetracentron sinense]